MVNDNVFLQRASGVLAHPTSFPGKFGVGDLGAHAYKFIDFLCEANQGLWQILPLGPTGYGNSPYQSFSAFAGNHNLICIEKLCEQGLLEGSDLAKAPAFDARRVDYDGASAFKMPLFRKAYKAFAQAPPRGYKSFCSKNAAWLDDYALFAALKRQYNGTEWFNWPTKLAQRDSGALKEARAAYIEEINFCKFLQYQFFTQWSNLKKYANAAGIKIIGDIPIFVAHDSCDVWAEPELYQLDKNGMPTAVAGVPPDYFSETGQLWGNPLYNWQAHKNTGYAWWCSRVKAALEIADIVRIDHFRGFESYWAIPYGQSTAIGGKWVKGPGKAFFVALKAALGELPIIAEDLGEITEKVTNLRNALHLPGMRVLHFAFDPSGSSAYLPHNFETSNTVVYSGTHDNNTTWGWYAAAPEAERDYLRRYLNVSGEDVAWDLIRLAISSAAVFAIVPLQDIMNLQESDRMNIPGQAHGCWGFRYTHGMLDSAHAQRLAYLTRLFGRG